MKIDWSNLLSDLEHKEGALIDTDPSKWNLDNPDYKEIYSQWKKVNFNMSSIGWINYYPTVHFSKEIEDAVAASVKFNGVHRSWISRINPGYMAPYHWDIDDRESEYLQQGRIVRYTFIIKDFAPGHIFILGKDYYYNLKKHTGIRWNNHREWHSGINAGLEPNWMYHILGY